MIVKTTSGASLRHHSFSRPTEILAATVTTVKMLAVTDIGSISLGCRYERSNKWTISLRKGDARKAGSPLTDNRRFQVYQKNSNLLVN